jgi:hypothetical protein
VSVIHEDLDTLVACFLPGLAKDLSTSRFKFLLLILIYLSTAIGLTPGGSTHLHINNTQNITINNKTTRITKKNTNNKFGRVLAVPSLCWPCPVLIRLVLLHAISHPYYNGPLVVRINDLCPHTHMIFSVALALFDNFENTKKFSGSGGITAFCGFLHCVVVNCSTSVHPNQICYSEIEKVCSSEKSEHLITTWCSNPKED